MINISLFKQSFKSNYKIILGFMLIMAMYFTVIVEMFDPDNLESMQKMFEALPKEMMSAFGMTLTNTTLIGFMSSYYYGFIAIIFPMLFSIIVANRLIAKLVDKGSMSYLLSTPNTRMKIATTQGAFLIFGITSIMIFITCLGVFVCESIHPGLLDIDKFLLLNFVTWLLQLAISGICFVSSCIFNETKNSLMFGAGIPIGFFVIQMLSNVSDKLDDLKYLTLMTFLDTDKIIEGSSMATNIIVLAILTVILYLIGIAIFKKKDLPL